MGQEILVVFPDRTFVYEECSHGEVLQKTHTMVLYLKRKAIKYYKLKEVKDILVGKNA
jgi:hypothetical protein